MRPNGRLTVSEGNGFDAAVATLRRARKSDDADVESLERWVLDRSPADGDEAAAIIDVVIYNLDAGPRTDGRDIRALRRIGHWLTRRPGQRLRHGRFLAQGASH